MRRNRPASRFAPKAIPELSNDAWLHAQALFVSGRITVSQAVAMMCSDCDFIAECELQGKDKALHADAIVRSIWAVDLLKNMRRAA